MNKIDVSKDRHLYIGASDIPAICGLSSYATPYEVYLEKTGELEKEKNINMEVGKRLEPVIRQLYLDTLEDKESNTPNQNLTDGWLFNDYEVTHKDYSFLKAHLDGYHEPTRTVLEIKTTGVNFLEIPIPYLLQVAFQCLLSDASEAHIAILKGTSFMVSKYERNQNLEKIVLDKALEFWGRVQERNPPPCRGEEDIKMRNEKIIKSISGEPLIAKGFTLEKINKFKEIKEEYDIIKKKYESAKVDLINDIHTHELIIDENGDALATYKYNKSREMIDKDKLKKEYPDIYERVRKQCSPARPLLIK